MRINIIDPASVEFNRGSFCYSPYLLYNSLKQGGVDVVLYEDFTLARIDELRDADETFVALWSYPQQDAALVLQRFLPASAGSVRFFGYPPLIQKLGLPLFQPNERTLLLGMRHYPTFWNNFKFLMLSDCDMHLKRYEGKVYPLFTSYGCPNGCEFCPSTVNQPKRVVLPEDQVVQMLRECAEQGALNIHFTDEDFFFDTHRAYKILTAAQTLSPDFKFIALGSAPQVLRYCRTFPKDSLAQVKLIEVGFETGDEDLARSMGKPNPSVYEELAAECPTDIFWLTLTFFPGETIGTLNKTGAFLRKHGWHPEDLYGRIRTNSTEAGLGQFFQPYDGAGCGTLDELEERGVILSDRPIRLLPSFIPYSLLEGNFKQVRPMVAQDDYWFALHKVELHPMVLGLPHLGSKVWGRIRLGHLANDAMAIAILARLGVIEPA